MLDQTKVYGMLGLSSRAGKITTGLDATIEAINKNQVYVVILAKDISENTQKKIEKICSDKKINIIYFGTIDENSRAIGKENKAVIAIKDENFANAILKIISGGDTTNG